MCRTKVKWLKQQYQNAPSLTVMEEGETKRVLQEFHKHANLDVFSLSEKDKDALKIVRGGEILPKIVLTANYSNVFVCSVTTFSYTTLNGNST